MGQVVGHAGDVMDSMGWMGVWVLNGQCMCYCHDGCQGGAQSIWQACAQACEACGFFNLADVACTLVVISSPYLI